MPPKSFYKPKGRKVRKYNSKKIQLKKTKSLGKMMRSIAKSEVSRQVEDKEYITAITGDTIGSGPIQFGTANFITNNIIDVSTETLNLVTQANGLTENGRIGNRIRLKSCVLRGTLNCSPTPLTPHYLKIWVVSSKLYPNSCTASVMEQICRTEFFNTSPTSSSAGMTGQMIDLCRTVNEDTLMVYTSRVYKLGFSSLPNPGLTQAGNNDFSYSRTFKLYLGRHMNKRIVYNDTAADPRNKKLFIVFEAVPADGSVGSNASYAVLNYFFDFKYEDA